MSTPERGFTLAEMLITVAIAAILAALAIPSYRAVVRKNGVANQTNAFLNLLTVARGEAVRRNRRIVLCTSTDGAACSTTSVNYDTGLLMFEDTNINGAVDAGEPVIRSEVPFAAAATITGSSNVLSSVAYGPDGQVLPADACSADSCIFTIKVGPSTDYCQRKIAIPATGRPRVDAGAIARYVGGSLVTGDTSCGISRYE